MSGFLKVVFILFRTAECGCRCYRVDTAMRCLGGFTGLLSQAKWRRVCSIPFVTWSGWSEQTHGCIIISGTTGAGKTTMLYSLMASMAGKRIISVEDPVECTVPGVLQLELNEKAGFDATRCFEEILRADPDWIAFGEVRTAEAARLTINAALSGHVVLFTLHAGSIEEAWLRLKTLGITTEELSVCKKIIHLYREEGVVRCTVEHLQSEVSVGS